MSLVLVTGATGFIGRHLCSLLVQRGYAVKGVFRNDASRRDFPAAIEWVNLDDIGSSPNWLPILEGVDYVIHLAALAHQIGSQGQGLYDEFMRINAAGTQHLAEAVSTSRNVKRLVYVSSVGAVTSFSRTPITETTPCHPEDDYGRSKRAAEKAIEKVLHNAGPDWCILRPPLVYGPGNPGNMARLIKLIDFGLPLPLGGIQNRRSMIFVGNLVHALEYCIWHPGASRQIFLISDGEDLSTPELIRQIARHLHKSVRLISIPSSMLVAMGRIGDFINRLTGQSLGLDSYSVQRLMGSLIIDSSTLRRATGWQPPFSLREGISQTFPRRSPGE